MESKGIRLESGLAVLDNPRSLCWKLSDHAQSLAFCSQIVTEWIKAMFLLVSEFKMIRVRLNVVHGQVQKN